MFKLAKNKIINDFETGTSVRPKLTVTFDNDMTKWKQLMDDTDWCKYVNPSFDIDIAGYDPADAFYITLRNAETNELAATQAVRIYRNCDLYDLLQQRTFWYNDPSPVDKDRVLIRPNLVHGNVGHDGNLFVNPLYRKMGIADQVSLMARMAMSERWDVDFTIGLVLKNLAEAGFPLKVYKFHHTMACTSSCLFQNLQEEVHLCYSSNDENYIRASQLSKT